MQNLFSKQPVQPLKPLRFGVATADHQCEAYWPDCPDIQDLWEETRNLTRRDRATDFWERYAEDVQLAQGMGCKFFRFSLAWSRLEPQPGVYDDAAFTHYRQMLETIRAAEMEPMVTLHHYTWPVHVEQRGGSVASDFPAIFATYADEVGRRLGDLVTYWVTFNEPNQMVFGYFKAGDYHLPPGLPPGTSVKVQMQKLRQLIPNLFKAHTQARAVLQSHNPHAKVGVNPLLFGFPRWSRWLVDWQVSNLREEDWERYGYRYTEQLPTWPRDVDVVIAMFSVTPERAQKLDFSEVYAIDGLRLLVPITSTAQGPADLRGQSIGVIQGSTAEQFSLTLLPQSTAKTYVGLSAAIQALDTGTITAVLADEARLQGWMQLHPHRYQLVGERLTQENYAVAVPKGHLLLLDAVDQAVQSFRESAATVPAPEAASRGASVAVASEVADEVASEVDDGVSGGVYSKVAQASAQVPNRKVLAYLSDETANAANTGNPSAPNLAPELAPDAAFARAAETTTADASQPFPLAEPGTWLRKIQDRGYLIVAVRDDVPGMGYRDPETGEYSGLETDLARAIAKTIFGDSPDSQSQHPNRVEFHPVKTHQRFSRLKSIFSWINPILQAFSTFSSILNSNWWHLGMAGKLPEFLCPQGCVQQQDFVGLDYYWGTSRFWPQRIDQLSQAAQGEYTGAPVWPEGLYYLLKHHAQLFPELEILLVENGCVIEADHLTRSEYIAKHLEQIVRARQEGVQVTGYVCWAITSNREWGARFGPNSDFGLYHIELDGDPKLQRIPTAAVQDYRNLIQAQP